MLFLKVGEETVSENFFFRRLKVAQGPVSYQTHNPNA